jgi:serine/threonine protein kinase
MKEFNPAPNDPITIGKRAYHVMPHPSVPAFAFGQEGRKAFVYQLANGDGRLYALKKFKQAYRLPELVEVCDSLARFATWQGLEVCDRQCLNMKAHKDVLVQYPDLEYAVLMAWIDGSTWYDILVGKRALSRLDALKTANATAQVLSALEEAGLAHCDIAAPNVIMDLYHGQAHLIDVEDVYAPGFTPPGALPAGTEGYAHKVAPDGLWGPAADRFAGAVLISEMATWFSPRIREAADDEHYFGADEMQIDSSRFQLMVATLNDVQPELGGLLEEAWASDVPEKCPQLHEWYDILNKVFLDEYHREQVAPIVSGWQPISAPIAEPDKRPAKPITTPAPKSEPAQQAAPASAPSENKPAPAINVSSPAAAPSINPAPARPITPAAPPMTTIGSTIKAPPPSSPVVEWRPIEVTVSTPAPEPTPAPEAAPQSTPILPPETAEQEPPPAAEPADNPLAAVGLLRPVLDVRVDPQRRPYISWSESPGASDYVLHESESAGFEKHQEYRVKAPRTFWEPPRLGWRRADKLYYRVRSRNKKDHGPWSAVAEVVLAEDG